jgi:hypothetical protein
MGKSRVFGFKEYNTYINYWTSRIKEHIIPE